MTSNLVSVSSFSFLYLFFILYNANDMKKKITFASDKIINMQRYILVGD